VPYSTARASALTAPSGKRYAGIGASSGIAPSTLMNVASTGLVVSPAARFMAAATSVAAVTIGGMKIVRTLSTPGSARSARMARS
jgi:hypothetical protein